jgi:hypothetical protein
MNLAWKTLSPRLLAASLLIAKIDCLQKNSAKSNGHTLKMGVSGGKETRLNHAK